MLSMTGFGESLQRQDSLSVRCELRAVNSRHLKLSARLPDGYNSLEPRIESLVRAGIRRGAVQLNLNVAVEATAESCQLDETAITHYFSQLRQLQQSLGQSGEIALEWLLALPGVVKETSRAQADLDQQWPVIQQAVLEAIDQLNQMRADEGRSLAKDLQENCAAILRELTEIERLAPRTVDAYQQRLLERINQLLSEHDVQVDPTAVIREVGIFAERVDISEETVRLRSHLQQFESIMSSEEGVGRKLEFLIQELLRETNTIGSKANDASIAQHVVQIKTNIERLREMIQNVE